MNKAFLIENILVDKEDEYLLNKHIWNIKETGHVRTKVNGKNTYLHSLIMNTRALIDHKNRNPLDNRKSNLRLANKSTNAMNSSIRIDNTSGYKGISWSISRSKWEVYITANKKAIKLGRYLDINEAIKVRLEAEIKYFGEYRAQ